MAIGTFPRNYQGHDSTAEDEDATDEDCFKYRESVIACVYQQST